jgi:hypothetical protein
VEVSGPLLQLGKNGHSGGVAGVRGALSQQFCAAWVCALPEHGEMDEDFRVTGVSGTLRGPFGPQPIPRPLPQPGEATENIGVARIGSALIQHFRVQLPVCDPLPQSDELDRGRVVAGVGGALVQRLGVRPVRV